MEETNGGTNDGMEDGMNNGMEDETNDGMEDGMNDGTNDRMEDGMNGGAGGEAKWVIDRFEENKAVLEDMETLAITVLERGDLPPDAREGDLIYQTNGAFAVDRAATEKRAQEMRARFNRLVKRA